MKRFAVISLLALGTVLTVSACNTIRGAGRDIQSVGHGVERATQTR